MHPQPRRRIPTGAARGDNRPVLFELLLYTELLLFIAGTLLYGFLARELLRRPDVLTSNRPLRLLAATLTLWYGGTLVDVWLVLLLGPVAGPSLAANALDLARAVAWLLALPLLLHTLERFDAAQARRTSRAARIAVGLGYLAPLAMAPAALRFAGSRSAYLGDVAATVHPRLAAVVAVTLLPTAWLALRLAGHVDGARLRRFFRDLGLVALLLVAAFALGLWIDPWATRPSLAGGLLRLTILGGMLWPGLLFAWHVQRHNLLRLSLSNRVLRRLALILGVVVLLVAVGPTLGLRDADLLRRLVAWGSLLAVVGGLIGPRLVEALAERSPALRSFLGHAVTAPAVDELSRSLGSLEHPPDQAIERTAATLGRWLGTTARSLERDPSTEDVWRFFEQAPSRDAAHRLARLPPQLLETLDRLELQAVFSVRVDAELTGVLGLAASATGGGYADGEIDAVRLVVRQLSATLTLRAAARARLAAERELAERERLGMLGLVSASLAHEIKNPLSSMKALAQALREDLAADDPTAGDAARRRADGVADLDVIVDQIDRLDHTAREILAFARPPAGATVDLEALVRSAVRLVDADARRRGIVLELGIGDDAETTRSVAGSVGAWQTIVLNLLLNAVEHAPDGGRVDARLVGTPEHTAFETRNPGRLDPSLDPFATFASRGDGGTGLGLALVARRVEALGGQVTAAERDKHVIVRVEIPRPLDP
ncbi:MAG: HAMP domain-containing sensor histidine kinase [Acidobacteriota bacterium]